MIILSWLSLCNLAIFALSICVLSGCRTHMERNYSIINWPRSTINLIWGDECGNVTADFIPDMYKFGASGVCRIVDGHATCKSHFPPSLNLAKAVLEDLSEANSTESQDIIDIIETCRETINKPIAHSTAEKLGTAMVSFIIVTIFINIISVVVAAATDSPWGAISTGVLVGDTLLIFASLVLCIAMMNYEGGGYLHGVNAQEYSDRTMMGLGVWLLVGMLIGRLVSNPWLIFIAVMIILPIVLVFLLFLVRTRGFLAVVRVVV